MICAQLTDRTFEKLAKISKPGRKAHVGGKITTNKHDALRRFYIRMISKGQQPTEAHRQAVVAAGLDHHELLAAALEQDVAAETEAASGGTGTCARSVKADESKAVAMAAMRRQLEAAKAKRAQALEALHSRTEAEPNGAWALDRKTLAKRRRLDSELDGLVAGV